MYNISETFLRPFLVFVDITDMSAVLLTILVNMVCKRNDYKL